MKGTIIYEEKSIYCNGIFYGSYASNATVKADETVKVEEKNVYPIQIMIRICILFVM